MTASTTESGDALVERARVLFGDGLYKVARAPYRMSVLGAHTDHQDGITSGFTLDRGIRLAFRPSDDSRVTLVSLDRDEEASVAPGQTPEPEEALGRYVAGILRVCGERMPAVGRGFSGVLVGELPAGGISSSAALQVAILLALQDVQGWSLLPMDAARIVRAAEQVSTGAQVGLLDPAVILHGRERGWVFLDCRKEVATVQRFPRNPPSAEWFLVDSGVPRSLAGTPYNERVAECAAAAAALGAGTRLRDVTPEDYRRKRSSLEPTLVRRCEHYFSEIKRVKLARRAVGSGDMVAIGRLMDASGRSLTDQFDCGTEETRTLLDLLRTADGTLGASYAGAGWGGLLQVLARPGSGSSLETAVARYRDLHPRVGSLARVIQVRPGPGVHVG